MKHNNLDRLLIVEDEPCIQRLYSALIHLHFPDVAIEVVCDGSSAVSTFEKTHPGTILMDASLPVLDGVTTCTQLQTLCRKLNWEVPSLIICSGTLCESDRLVVDAMRPTPAVLPKPVRNGDLLVELTRALRRPKMIKCLNP
jgi:CheY-like chemotaxis protein